MCVRSRARIPLVPSSTQGIGDRVNRWRLRRREGYDKVDDNDRSRELLTKLDGLVTIIPLVYGVSASSKKLVLGL